jgi:WD40 repeat protein
MRLLLDDQQQQCYDDESSSQEKEENVWPEDVQQLTSLLDDKPLAPAGNDSEMDGRMQQRQRKKKPMLISGSLDNTIKMWDIETGKTVSTFFGHIEGVWAIASDKLRLVSGSHDRTIKVCLFRDSTLDSVDG